MAGEPFDPPFEPVHLPRSDGGRLSVEIGSGVYLVVEHPCDDGTWRVDDGRVIGIYHEQIDALIAALTAARDHLRGAR